MKHFSILSLAKRVLFIGVFAAALVLILVIRAVVKQFQSPQPE